jgi:agmatine deiminase
MSSKLIEFPAEWGKQSGVMLTWPHQNTDWAPMLNEVEACFIEITKAISCRERVLIICPNKTELAYKLQHCQFENITLVELQTNDTWARDHGPITTIIDGKMVINDFTFNGWGLKFNSDFDNQLTASLFEKGIFQEECRYENHQDLILEGGSIESDGEGTLLTTKECLFSENRNNHLSEEQLEQQLIELFGLKRILWLSSGYLAGDDTDSHIDTLARFCDAKTIAYVKCDDSTDEHFLALQKMEQELKSFRTLDDEPYKLIELPMAEAEFDEGQRLPATYANFLIINGAVLVPIYNSPRDNKAMSQIKLAFPDRNIIGIDCRSLIKQNGSLHCITMQFPVGVI